MQIPFSYAIFAIMHWYQNTSKHIATQSLNTYVPDPESFQPDPYMFYLIKPLSILPTGVSLEMYLIFQPVEAGEKPN